MHLQEQVVIVLVHLSSAKGVREHCVDQLLVYLIFLFFSTVNKEDVTFALTIEDPRVVNYIVIVDEALIRVLNLL